MSRFGLSPQQFMDITPQELYLALKDHSEVEESKIRPVAEAIRYQTWWLVNVQLPKNKKIRKPEHLFGLKWDKQQHAKLQSPEQMGKVFRAITKRTEKGKPRERKRGPTGIRIKRATMEDYNRALNGN